MGGRQPEGVEKGAPTTASKRGGRKNGRSKKGREKDNLCLDRNNKKDLPFVDLIYGIGTFASPRYLLPQFDRLLRTEEGRTGIGAWEEMHARSGDVS